MGRVLPIVAGLIAFALVRALPSVPKPDRKGVPGSDPNDPRGIRNNNPGNLRWDGVTQWRGMIGQDPQGFIQFEAPVWGIRAMVRDLQTGFRRDGENTITQIIREWAPPVENDTVAYIKAVEQTTGFPADLVLAEDSIPSLLKAIVKHENGQQPYADDLYSQAVALA